MKPVFENNGIWRRELAPVPKLGGNLSTQKSMLSECTLSQFDDDTNWEEWLPHQSVQRDLGRLEKWADRKFNKGKCKILYLGRIKPRHQYMLEDDHLKSSSEEQDLD
ncbi:rna-directed dna polymerase from mobile element jockey-like [Willisornis vidua]|uniref:Rna-directed dna polymerase from mobile element jockey-like n=1 Tax=Willisornis vidua TaxID=1566151 RepID=A0ABQ9CYR2_9PASS|nr:rna-directed dna polymerase from mobile element jockey-like [Willisornis vidua]